MAESAPIVFLTGATGFVGRHVLARLVEQGYHVRALVRGVRRGGILRTPGGGGGVEEVVGEIGGKDGVPALAAAMAGCEAVIHLVGIIRETRRSGSFWEVHVEGTRQVVAAARRAGVRRFVHMSALGTRPKAVARYHQSKWRGEEAVRQGGAETAGGLDWTIFRPSLIHGPDGEFTQMLRKWVLSKAPPYFFMPYFGGGFWGQSHPRRVQPVYVADVAAVFVDALSTPAARGKTYDLPGPTSYTWPELLRVASAVFQAGPPILVLGIPAWLAGVMARIAGGRALPFTRDQVIMSREDNVGDLEALRADFPQVHVCDFPAALYEYAVQMGEVKSPR